MNVTVERGNLRKKAIRSVDSLLPLTHGLFNRLQRLVVVAAIFFGLWLSYEFVFHQLVAGEAANFAANIAGKFIGIGHVKHLVAFPILMAFGEENVGRTTQETFEIIQFLLIVIGFLLGVLTTIVYEYFKYCRRNRATERHCDKGRP